MRPTILVALIFSIGTCAAQVPQRSPYRWTQFVNVEGQPEPVPIEWVSTPEGKFAHSIKIPNPLPKDSGYRSGMSSEQYFEHLCKTEAGEFVYKTVENVEGFYFMRPPRKPSDDDLKDRYKLEAPEIERLFQLLRDTPVERAQLFVNPPWGAYAYIEEPTRRNTDLYVRSFGYRQGTSPMKSEVVQATNSRYGIFWRGIRRTNDRENGISGGEWIIIDLLDEYPVAVFRNFGVTGRTRGTPDGVWWLNARSCPGTKTPGSPGISELYRFVSRALRPKIGG